MVLQGLNVYATKETIAIRTVSISTIDVLWTYGIPTTLDIHCTDEALGIVAKLHIKAAIPEIVMPRPVKEKRLRKSEDRKLTQAIRMSKRAFMKSVRREVEVFIEEESVDITPVDIRKGGGEPLTDLTMTLSNKMAAEDLGATIRKALGQSSAAM